MSIAITGAKVLTADGMVEADVLVTGSTIAGIGSDIPIPRDADVIDATGAVIIPGLVDLNAHLCEPGHEEAETIETGSRGAALGGYTAVVAMPDTEPAIDSLSLVRDVRKIAERALCEVVPAAALTVGRKGELLAPMGELAAEGVRIFSDAGRGVQDPAIMRSIMEYATGLHVVTGGSPVVLAQHCEVEALTAGGHMHEGEWATRLGMKGQPSEAETLMMSRDIALARMTGARLHFQHISTAGSVELVRSAKAEGLAVTAEVTTHHFTLTDAACANYDPVFKVSPPLRTDDDIAAIRAGLAEGTIDCIVTDHAPHEPHTKEFPFDQAPTGVLGFESAFAIALTELDLPIERVVELMSTRPAEIAGIGDRHGALLASGNRANLAVIDPGQTWTIDGHAMASRSHNSPYDGREVTGKVTHTIYEGDLVVADGVATK